MKRTNYQTTLLEAQLDPSKLLAMATDGYPSMLGANQGLINKWREKNAFSPVTWHHSISHYESLVAKSLDMSNKMKVAISTVNWIRANTLNQRSATCGSGAACGSFSPLLSLP